MLKLVGCDIRWISLDKKTRFQLEREREQQKSTRQNPGIRVFCLCCCELAQIRGNIINRRRCWFCSCIVFLCVHRHSRVGVSRETSAVQNLFIHKHSCSVLNQNWINCTLPENLNLWTTPFSSENTLSMSKKKSALLTAKNQFSQNEEKMNADFLWKKNNISKRRSHSQSIVADCQLQFTFELAVALAFKGICYWNEKWNHNTKKKTGKRPKFGPDEHQKHSDQFYSGNKVYSFSKLNPEESGIEPKNLGALH